MELQSICHYICVQQVRSLECFQIFSSSVKRKEYSKFRDLRGKVWRVKLYLANKQTNKQKQQQGKTYGPAKLGPSISTQKGGGSILKSFKRAELVAAISLPVRVAGYHVIRSSLWCSMLLVCWPECYLDQAILLLMPETRSLLNRELKWYVN